MYRYKAKFSMCSVKHHAAKAYGEWRYSSLYSSARYEMGAVTRSTSRLLLLPVLIEQKASWVNEPVRAFRIIYKSLGPCVGWEHGLFFQPVHCTYLLT
jgi:hypothetical protein